MSLGPLWLGSRQELPRPSLETGRREWHDRLMKRRQRLLLSHSQFPNLLLQSGSEISLNVVVYAEFTSDNLPVIRIIVDFDAILGLRDSWEYYFRQTPTYVLWPLWIMVCFCPLDLLHFLVYGSVFQAYIYIYIFIYLFILEEFSMKGFVAYLLNPV